MLSCIYSLIQGSLVANMVLGMIILKRRYTFRKYFSVLIVTIGLIIVTLASSSTPKTKEHPNSSLSNSSSTLNDQIFAEKSSSEAAEQSFSFLIGIGLLTLGLFVSTSTGVYQEKLFSTHGKHPGEAQFYTVRN